MKLTQKFLLTAVLTLGGSGHVMAENNHASASHAKGTGVFDNDSVVDRTISSIAQWPPLRQYLTGPKAITVTANIGHITLEGVVRTEADRANIGVRANAVPGIFSVENKLQVERR